jgi:type IV fimbrial biogenesis protein FimT
VTARAASKGFTLIELMVALLIAGLLLMLGMPSFTTFLRNSEIRSTAESLVNGLRTASAEAARRNVPGGVTFTIDGGGGTGWTGWTITYKDENDATQTIQSYAKKEGGANVALTLAPAGKPSVTFTGLGRVAQQGTAGDHLQQIDIATAVTGEGRPLRIIVDDPNPDAAKRRGLRMCDPDPALTSLSPPDPRAC